MTATKQDNQGDWSPDQYNSIASFVYSAEFITPVLGLLKAQPGEKIIDFGCGSGEVTLELQKVVGKHGVVVGVDSSKAMIEKARQNGVNACFVADVQDLHLPHAGEDAVYLQTVLPESFDYKFDAVFSNAALHWCKRSPRGAVESAARALKKGGRFAAELGGFTNCVGLIMAVQTVLQKRGYDSNALMPWYFPSEKDYQKLLEDSGFEVKSMSLNPRFTPLKSDIIDWQSTFCRSTCYAGMNDQEAETVMREVQDMCEIDMKDSSGNWAIMYTRLRFVAVLV